MLSLSVAWQAYVQDAPHLYITAAIALRLQGDHHSRRAAPHHRAARHPSRRRERRRHRPDHARRPGAGGAVGGGDAARGERGGCAGARGSRLRAVGGAARHADDGDAAQRGEHGGRLHVAGERADPRRGGRQGHAAGGRDLRRLFGAGRLHRDRRVPVPHQRAVRDRRRARSRPIPGRAASERAPLRRRGGDPDSAGGDGGAARACCPAIGFRRRSTSPRRSRPLSPRSRSLFVKPASGDYFLVDDLNIVFIVLNTFVAFTTSVFSAELHRPRAGDRPADADPSALLSRDVSGAAVRDESRAGRQQYRPDVGGDRDGDADHGGDGRHLPHATRRSKRRGNTSSSAASASRWRCSAPSSSTWRRGR